MQKQRRQRQAFTLLEIALSIGILAFGLTAVVTVYMVSLKWAEEIRVDLTALQTARVALYDAGVLLNDDDTPTSFSNRDEEAKGWMNDYYVVRTYDKSEAINLPNNGGLYTHVRVKIYYGGNDKDGQLAHEMVSHYIIPKAYLP
jgi:type II secretory pathway pseudopilin PulG